MGLLPKKKAEKCCVVIGGAGGLGAYYAKKYAQQKYAIAFVDVDLEAGKKFEEELKQEYGVKAVFLHADAYSVVDMELFASLVNLEFHRVDVLIDSFRNCPYTKLIRPYMTEDAIEKNLYGLEQPED